MKNEANNPRIRLTVNDVKYVHVGTVYVAGMAICIPFRRRDWNDLINNSDVCWVLWNPPKRVPCVSIMRPF